MIKQPPSNLSTIHSESEDQIDIIALLSKFGRVENLLLKQLLSQLLLVF